MEQFVLDRPVTKTCHRCGVDLVDKPRYRDRHGYWCVPCGKADQKAYRANHLPCDDCGADIHRGQEIVRGEVRICSICAQQRDVDQLRVQLRREAEEKKQQQTRQRWQATRNWTFVAVELLAAGLLLRYISASPAATPSDRSRRAPATMPAQQAPYAVPKQFMAASSLPVFLSTRA